MRQMSVLEGDHRECIYAARGGCDDSEVAKRCRREPDNAFVHGIGTTGKSGACGSLTAWTGGG